MPKKVKKQPTYAKSKAWKEGELMDTFHLNRIATHQTPLMQAWLNVELPELNFAEQYYFDKLLVKAQRNLVGWNEEDLKVKFIGPILELGHLMNDDTVIAYFDKTISAIVDKIPMLVKSDFMLAKGTLNVVKTPYFHFQEYKPELNPSGEPMAQLLEAFLIAQVVNNNQQPMYGIEISGANWQFVVMEDRDYCISKSFDATDKTGLLMIIAILRKFKAILDHLLAK